MNLCSNFKPMIFNFFSAILQTRSQHIHRTFSWQDSPKCLFIGVGAVPCHRLSCAWHVWAGTCRALACWGRHCIRRSCLLRDTNKDKITTIDFFLREILQGNFGWQDIYLEEERMFQSFCKWGHTLILLKLCLSYGEHTDYDGFTFLWRNATNGLQVAVFNNH